MHLDLVEIDRMISKASDIRNEARRYIQRVNYDLCVRRSQEAFELYLKTMFQMIEKKLPPSHDITKQIYDTYEILKDYNISAQEVAQIILAHQTLNLWRNRSFYGDQKLGTSGIFKQKEAELALDYALRLSIMCSTVRYLVSKSV